MTKFVGRMRNRRYLRRFVPRRINRGKTDTKNIRTTLEIVGECIALGVLIVMVFQYTLSRKAIDKMAEQNVLSACSLARIDSTIQLMHEANELSRESNYLTKEYVRVELGKFQIEESRLQEELRPRLVINPLWVDDIIKDTLKNSYTAWITIHNDGASEAQEVTISNTIANLSQILDTPQNSRLKNIPPKNSKHHQIELPSKSGDLFLLIQLNYKWILPSGRKSPYNEEKAYQLYRDSLTYDIVRSLQITEDDIDYIFRKKK